MEDRPVQLIRFRTTYYPESCMTEQQKLTRRSMLAYRNEDGFIEETMEVWTPNGYVPASEVRNNATQIRIGDGNGGWFTEEEWRRRCDAGLEDWKFDKYGFRIHEGENPEDAYLTDEEIRQYKHRKVDN